MYDKASHPRPLLKDRPEPFEDVPLQVPVLGQVHHVARSLHVVGDDVVLRPLLLLRRIPAGSRVAVRLESSTFFFPPLSFSRTHMPDTIIVLQVHLSVERYSTHANTFHFKDTLERVG